MIGGLSVLGLIPARGGSKGVPRKNIRLLGGKPLLQWTADAALASRHLDRVIISTDDPAIAHLAADLGIEVPFHRPDDLASDSATAADVVLHAIRVLDTRYDVLVYLQPTSPLRTVDDIDQAIERMVETGADACVSVHLAPLRADLLVFLGPGDRIEPIAGSFAAPRRQDVKACYELNGAVYVTNVGAYERNGSFVTEQTVAYVMPLERGLDLDELADFDLAEAVLRQDREPVDAD